MSLEINFCKKYLKIRNQKCIKCVSSSPFMGLALSHCCSKDNKQCLNKQNYQIHICLSKHISDLWFRHEHMKVHYCSYVHTICMVWCDTLSPPSPPSPPPPADNTRSNHDVCVICILSVFLPQQQQIELCICRSRYAR